MTADRAPNTGPEPGEAPPGGARRTARQLFKQFEGPVDDHFKQSLAGLSSRLGERAAWQSTNDPKATAEARRAALQAYDLARARRWKVALKATGAAIAAAGVAGLTMFIAMPPNSPPDSPSPRAMASRERASPIEMAAITPAPTPLPTASAASPAAIVPVVAQVAPSAADEPAPVDSASVMPEPAPLRRDEVREIQTRLHSFGFSPGSPDGAAGPMTQAAVMRYQQNRGLPQTATIDRAFLEQLRQDPAPPVAAPQVAQQAERPARASSATRQSDPFQPLRVAAQNVERWFQSLGR